MDRLTKRDENGTAFIVLDENSKEWSVSVDQPSYAHTIECEAVDKLAEYEDAEEQGLLLRLPCKVGDTVFEVMNGKMRTLKIIRFDVFSQSVFAFAEHSYGRIYQKTDCFGKTVFLTKEEAEQKLAEMKGE